MIRGARVFVEPRAYANAPLECMADVCLVRFVGYRGRIALRRGRCCARIRAKDGER